MESKPVYKTVTVNEETFLIDEKAEIKKGDWYVDDFMMIQRALTPDKYRWSKRSGCVKIIAQEVTNELEDIPYYELTPQEETDENLTAIALTEAKLQYAGLPTEKMEDILYRIEVAKYSYMRGYKAAKAKEFTEEQMMKAMNYAHISSFESIEDRYFGHKRFIKSLRQPMKIVSAEFKHDDNGNLELTEKDGKQFVTVIRFNYE